MKSLLERVNEVDLLIRQLRKLASRIRSGENVDGWRECQRMIAALERSKQALISGEEVETSREEVEEGEEDNGE